MKYENYTIYYDWKGYPIIWVDGKNVKLHVFIWEREHGERPKGIQIHHIDGNKKNYSLDNLVAMNQSDHFRVHAGWIKTDGEWSHKPCNGCNKVLPLKDFYFRKTVNNYTALCKRCHIERTK